jgi:hypothetical protein
MLRECKWKAYHVRCASQHRAHHLAERLSWVSSSMCLQMMHRWMLERWCNAEAKERVSNQECIENTDMADPVGKFELPYGESATY